MVCAPQSPLYGRTQKVTNGKVISERSFINEFNICFNKLLKDISINQWRNISQHSSYQYNTTTNLIHCVYENNNSIDLSLSGLESMMITIDKLPALLKIIVDFFISEFIDNFKLGSSLKITIETIISTLGNVLSLNNYSLLGLDNFVTN